jgi:ribosomal protein L35AE/L33A
MTYPGLLYPRDNNYLTQIKNSGYFILVDRNAVNTSLLPGGEINKLLGSNPKLLFVFDVHITGTRQDIIDALYLSGYSLENITQTIASAICIDNVNSSTAQQWISLFQKQNLAITNTQINSKIIVAQPPIHLTNINKTQTVKLTHPQQSPQQPQPIRQIPQVQISIPQQPQQSQQPQQPQPIRQIPQVQISIPQQPQQSQQPQPIRQIPQVQIPIPQQPRPISTTIIKLKIEEPVIQPMIPQTMEPIIELYHKIENTNEIPNLSYPVKSSYNEKHISYLRQLIHDDINRRYLGGNGNFEIIPNILEELLKLYDDLFFKKQLSEMITKDKIQLSLGYSDKLTKTGGYCDREGCVYNIKLSQPIIMGTFRRGEKSHTSNGLQCHDRLECLMNVFEHELIHFIIGITHGHIKGDPIYKAHGLYFQQLMKAFFGHTEFKHSLTRNIDKPGKREDFKLGDHVSFESNNGEIITGTIEKLNPKRAIIGTYSVPYTLVRHATETEIQKYTQTKEVDVLVTKISTLNVKDKPLNIGDIVSYEIKGKLSTGRISQINPKTYVIGNYKVSKQIVRHANEIEKNIFLLSPAAIPEKTRADFHLGQTVKFTNSKTKQTITGIIEKLNPTRAVIGQYMVPYNMLSPAQ